LTWVFLLVEARARNGNFAAISSTPELWNLKRRDKLPLVKTLYGEDSTVEGSDTG